MDASTFDRLTRTLATRGSRRAALGALLTTAGAALGLAGTQRASAQECFSNGTRCHLGTDCCSGRCKRRNNGKKVCMRAEHQGVCTIEENICAGSGDISCGTASSGIGCRCFVTVKGHSFCGDFFTIQQTEDCDCASNKECEQRIGKGAKCIQAGSNCRAPSCPPSTTSGCMAPCEILDLPE